MRYESKVKARDVEVRRVRRDRPELSLKEIGEIFNISRQRVHQIIKNEKR